MSNSHGSRRPYRLPETLLPQKIAPIPKPPRPGRIVDDPAIKERLAGQMMAILTKWDAKLR